MVRMNMCIGIVCTLCLTAFCLSGCQSAPKMVSGSAPLLSHTSSAKEVSSEELPSHLKDVITKGPLSVNVDADIIINQSAMYNVYRSDFVDWNSPNILDSLIEGLSDNSEVERVQRERGDGYNYLWTDRHGINQLSIIPHIRCILYSASIGNERTTDTTWPNRFNDGDETGITTTASQAEQMAIDIIKRMDIDDFDTSESFAFGKLYDISDRFFEVKLRRVKDGIRICDPYFQYTDGQKEPLEDSALVNVGEDGIWGFELYASEIGAMISENVEVIDFAEAYALFSRIGFAQISGLVAQGDNIVVREIELCYSHVGSPDTDGYILTPVWAFRMAIESIAGDNVTVQDHYVLFDAQTGAPLI